MIKKQLLLSILSLFISFSVFAEMQETEREERQLKDFTAIVVSSGIDVYITQADEFSVEVEASKNVMHRIITELRGNTLHVYVKGKFRWGSKDIRKVFISAPEINKLVASGGADIHGSTPLKTELLVLTSSGGADIYVSVKTSTVKMTSSGGADISVDGSCDQVNAVASGGADINAKKLIAQYVNATASGGGTIEVYASERIYATASGGGDINYTGSPKDKQISESGGGDVTGH